MKWQANEIHASNPYLQLSKDQVELVLFSAKLSTDKIKNCHLSRYNFILYGEKCNFSSQAAVLTTGFSSQ